MEQIDKVQKDLQKKLLQWYDEHKRDMPWRAHGGRSPDPYHIWLSEIMLQQTTVAAVTPYFEKFTTRWPSVYDLAKASHDEVMSMWAGLGYYARARNLHKCAKMIVVEYEGEFPRQVEGLLKLPGIGPYTAAAIASIAFNVPVIAVDGNVERVTARFFNITDPMPRSKPMLKGLAESLGQDSTRPADMTQAFMELGATICTPKSPKCFLCPWRGDCEALQQGNVEKLPYIEKKKAKPKRNGDVFWIVNTKGQVLVRKRNVNGLLGGMVEFPSLGWSDSQPGDDVLLEFIQNNSEVSIFPNAIRHVFTHFELSLNVKLFQKAQNDFNQCFQWVDVREFEGLAFPSLMQKVKSFILKTV